MCQVTHSSFFFYHCAFIRVGNNGKCSLFIRGRVRIGYLDLCGTYECEQRQVLLMHSSSSIHSLLFCLNFHFSSLQQPPPPHNRFPPLLAGVSSCCAAVARAVCRCSFLPLSRESPTKLRWQAYAGRTGFVLIQRNWHLHCIMLFAFTFFSDFGFRALPSISL